MFDAGDARAAHDRVFTPMAADRMAELLFSIPAPARYYAKQELFRRLRQVVSAGAQSLTSDDVTKVWSELKPALGLR
jgi:hypothetical protein